MNLNMNIAIYCGSSLGNKKIYGQKAKEIINYLSKKDVSIIYGGSKSGLMGIISNESIELNMEVTGVIPKHLTKKEILNDTISNIYFVKDIRERKAKMEELSDAFIAIPGGYGTLEEISEVFTSIQIGSHSKPCALYNQNGYYNKLIQFLKNWVKEGFIK